MKKIFLKRMTSLFAASLMAFGNMSNLSFAREDDSLMSKTTSATVYGGSRVAYNDSRYERDEVLEVAGEPFFYNGVQIRIDKVVDRYNFTDEQVKELFRIAANDGFTVVNAQIRWMDVQQDESFNATETAYVRGGNYADSVLDGFKTFYGSGEENRALGYVKFDISGWSKGDIEAARLRIYNNTAIESGQIIEVYGVDTDWKKDTLTWNNAPGIESGEVTGELLCTSDSWDLVDASEYYDFDLGDYVERARSEGKTEVSFIVRNTSSTEVNMDAYTGNRPPKIFLSSKEEYDWEYLDRIIGYAEEYGLKLEILWFSTDTCSVVSEIRLPYYVLSNYRKCLYASGVPWMKKANSDITGIYYYLMCKNDMELREAEYTALQSVFNHIAEYNEKNGNKNTVIGCQVCNEPNVARLHGGKLNENGVTLQNCMCDTCVALKKKGGYTDQGFRDWVMFEYCNNLSKAVKKSNYPVWTRVNNVNGCDAWGVEYNEKMRTKGGTDTDSGTYLDFIGLDPYGWSRSQLYQFGHGSYATGSNLPVVMESGGEKSMSALMMLATLAGGGYYNVYDLCSPDGHHLYDQNLQPRVISAGDKYLPNGGTYIEDVRNHNHWLKKIAYPLASMQPESLGGKNLFYFNCEGTDLSNINITKQMGGMSVTYKSDTQYSAGIALKKSDTEVVLLSSKDTDATFTLSDIANSVKSVEFGHYEGSEWIKDDGEVTYKASGTNLVVTMPQFSVVKVETSSPLPLPVVFEAEDYITNGQTILSSSVTQRVVNETTASGEKWACFEKTTTGATVTLSVTVPEDMKIARVATGYKGKPSGRADLQLYINGVKYGSVINQTEDKEGFYETAYGPVIELKVGEVNTFQYKTTSSGIVCIDYISFMKAEEMPKTMDGTVLINEDFSSETGDFGFDKGASVSGGVLNITENMGNYTTSVKMFDAEVINQSAIELSFDWKSNITSAGKKSGIEFRDLYGRLIFAIESKGGTIFRHSVTGWDSDSSHSYYNWEPIWTETDMDRTKTYHVRLIADFETKVVSYAVTEKDTGLIVAQIVNAPTEAINLAKMVACNYYTVEKEVSYEGKQNIDNFILTGADGNIDLPCAGKIIYAFGDSIIDGHKYQKMGFVEFAALQNDMTVEYNGALNGADITSGAIKNQLDAAPEKTPDIVFFDGGINNAYKTSDMDGFKEAFEELVVAMRMKWSGADLVYVAVHKTAAREAECQRRVYTIAMEICQKHGVSVVDMYNSQLDTNIQDLRWNYTFDELGEDSLPGNMGNTSSEKYSSTYPTGTHPNFRAIEKYYVTAVTALINTNYKFIVETTLEAGNLTITATGADGECIAAFYTDDILLETKSFKEEITLSLDEAVTMVKVYNWGNSETLNPLTACETIDITKI